MTDSSYGSSTLADESKLSWVRPGQTPPIRITRVKTVVVRKVPTGGGLIRPWDPNKIPQDTRDYVIVQFFTNAGLIGTTMDGDYELPEDYGATIDGKAQYFVGKDPFEIEVHNRNFFEAQGHSAYTFGLGKIPLRLFFLEIGLWDIIGKALGQPLYRLWGAARNKVQAYAATVHFGKSPEERAEDALAFYEKGFRALKLRLHHLNPDDDLKLAAAVMKAVGGKMKVMADANMGGNQPGDPPPAWDFKVAERMALALQDLGLYWLEEALPLYDYAGMARIRKQLNSMHLAGGEGNIGFAQFREILRQDSLSYIQPDPMIGGPVSVIRKIAAMGEGFGVKFGPHHGKSGVGMLTNLHMQCAAPNSGFIEYMYDPGYWNPAGFQAGFAELFPIDQEGYMHVPNFPGLGIQWDREFFRKHGLEYQSPTA
jgi:L-alanine-DL-glutamate epimerase-like enolase superfamily enzyme